MELENLLGLTNSLREAALQHVLNYRQSGSQIDLQEAESLLERSVRISKEIGDNPGLAKGYHHLCWIAMTLGKQSQFEERRVAAEYYLGFVEAPRWASRRLKDLRIWARHSHPKPSDLSKRMWTR